MVYGQRVDQKRILHWCYLIFVTLCYNDVTYDIISIFRFSSEAKWENLHFTIRFESELEKPIDNMFISVRVWSDLENLQI